MSDLHSANDEGGKHTVDKVQVCADWLGFTRQFVNLSSPGACQVSYPLKNNGVVVADKFSNFASYSLIASLFGDVRAVF